MPTAPFPPYNPFPPRGVASMEERVLDSAIEGWSRRSPTAELPPIERLRTLLENYLKDIAEPDSDPGLGRDLDLGQLTFLHGDHGSGKTHTVRYLLGRLGSGGDRTPTSLRLYVKAQSADFVACYRQLMAQLTADELRELSLRFLGVLAAEEAHRTRGRRLGEAVRAELEADPDRFEALLEKLLLEPGAVLEAQAAELDRVAGDAQDFQRALTYLTDPRLGEAAYHWLAGQPVDEAARKRMGVGEPITDPEVCRYGIQTLVSLCSRILRPVVIVIDQCERLILDEQDHYHAVNVGLLRSLAESVPRDNGALILVGNEDSWWALPRDFRQRFGHNDLATSIVNPDQAAQLLGAYIKAALPGTPPTATYPFSDAAVRTLLTLSGGNIRRLLQLSWEAFEEAAADGEEITSDRVEIATGRGPAPARGPEVNRAIERVLLDEGMDFERDWRDEAVHADFAVLVDRVPRIVIEVRESLFQDEDSQGVLDNLELIERRRRDRGWPVRVILIVIGYASPAVLRRLSRAAHDVIIYQDESSLERLREIAHRMSSQSDQRVNRSAEAPVTAGALPRGIHYLWESLDRFAARRPTNRHLPVLLLGPSTDAEQPDPTAARLISSYRNRLVDRTRFGETISLLPHALIDDEEFQDGAGAHLDLIDAIARQFAHTMPPGSGRLSLPRYAAVRTALNVDPDEGSHADHRARLRQELLGAVHRGHPSLSFAEKLTASESFVSASLRPILSMANLLVVGVVQRAYELWLGSKMPWLRKLMKVPGRGFVGAAVELGRHRDNVSLVQHVLLMALLQDLHRAALPSRLSLYWPRRQWAFVLLLTTVGGLTSPTRRFLNALADILSEERNSVLMVLGALTGPETPSFAAKISAEPPGPFSGLVRRITDLYGDPSAETNRENAYHLPLPAQEDDGVARDWRAARLHLQTRKNRARDQLRPLCLLLPLVLAAAALGFLTPTHFWCKKLPSGERVGVSNGQMCTLATAGNSGDALRELQRIVALQNQAVDTSAAYRSVVFFAPLSTDPRTSPDRPHALDALRGAIVAQRVQNAVPAKSHMPLRLLVANAGDSFSSGESVARQIIARQAVDRIVGVVGITETRDTSISAVTSLSDAQIPVIGTGVKGTALAGAGAPSRYFQVSAPNSRIAAIMAAFARRSDLYTETRTRPRAVVVSDPTDQLFSADLAAQFQRSYRDPVDFAASSGTGLPTASLEHLCGKGPPDLIVNTGRSGSLQDIVSAFAENLGCRSGGRTTALLSATGPTDPAAAAELLQSVPSLALYVVGPPPVDETQPYAKAYEQLFGDDQTDNSAESYDAFTLLSIAVDRTSGLYGPAHQLEPKDVSMLLGSPGVHDYLGATGVITLDAEHRYPPDRAISIRRITSDGTTTVLACGLLPNLQIPASWGPTGHRSPCPTDR